MRLEEAAGYFSSRLPRAFRVVEEVDSPKGSEGVQLAKGECCWTDNSRNLYTSLRISARIEPFNEGRFVPCRFSLFPDFSQLRLTPEA